MKKIFLLFVSASLLTLMSCSDDDRGQATPSAQAMLFTEPTKLIFTFDGTEGTEDIVTIGTVKPVSGDHTVNLVFDAENSTMEEGVDFDIIQGTTQITNGNIFGEFKVFYYTNAATEEGKRAVFKLESPTLNSAIFKNTYSARVSFACPMENFYGVFQGNTWWLGTSVHEIIEVDGAENQFKVIGFWEDNLTNSDLILRYSPLTFTVSLVGEQDTGYFHSVYGKNIFARPATGTGVSTVNACSRELRVVINYYIPGVGSFGDQMEVFTGL